MFQRCLDTIRVTCPEAFILKNVRNRDEATLRLLGEKLATLRGDYEVHTDVVLNSKHHGVPQNRERWYIVGLRRESMVAPFRKPEPVPTPGLVEFLNLQPTDRSLEQDLTAYQAAVMHRNAEKSRDTGRFFQERYCFNAGGSKCT